LGNLMRIFMTQKGESLDTARSLWAATSSPGVPASPLTRNEKADVVVVGAGYVGLSAAIHLAEAGKHVAVVDTAEPGWGASGRNNGQVIPGLKIDPDAVLHRLGEPAGERLVEWSGDAPDLVFNLIDRFRMSCQAARNGWIQPAHSRQAVKQIDKRYQQWRVRRAPVELLAPERLPTLLGTSEYYGAWLDRRGGWLNPLAYCRGLADAARDLGVRIYSRTPVLRLDHSVARWAIHTPLAEVSARQVVIATGAYCEVNLVNGLRQSIVPIRTAQVATRPLPPKVAMTILPERQGASDTRHLLTSFRVTPDGRLVMGGAGATGGVENPSLFRSLHLAAQQLFGHLGRFEWEFAWSGRLAVTADQLPHLHEPVRDLIAALGCNGRGIAISTALGKVIAERLLSPDCQDSTPIPITGIRGIPLHALCGLGVAAATQFKRIQDRFDRVRSRLA
jgi:glycine/D-amino acid oxidase-like deaminating enzyme